MRAKETIETLKDMKCIFSQRGHSKHSLEALDKAIGVFELLDSWDVGDLTLDELDEWKNRARWHIDYVADEKWKDEDLDVYLVVEVELQTGNTINIGVFSTKEKAQEFILNEDKSGDYYEYGITNFIVNSNEKGDVE